MICDELRAVSADAVATVRATAIMIKINVAVGAFVLAVGVSPTSAICKEHRVLNITKQVFYTNTHARNMPKTSRRKTKNQPKSNTNRNRIIHLT